MLLFTKYKFLKKAIPFFKVTDHVLLLKVLFICLLPMSVAFRHRANLQLAGQAPSRLSRAAFWVLGPKVAPRLLQGTTACLHINIFDWLTQNFLALWKAWVCAEKSKCAGVTLCRYNQFSRFWMRSFIPCPCPPFRCTGQISSQLRALHVWSCMHSSNPLPLDVGHLWTLMTCWDSRAKG